ncbi:MAG: lytic murein transglycosylase B [Pseudomonadota bacterium]|uniref:lytic murein transglycosylase B n=1 Tax=Methylophaga aminisulfidivorans TaxID=230105 RepID=UPI0024E26410|nr:lytic murein transglycosylase B [Methylophaga aminisulfidivorans]MEC9412819.1 lytic murein transglycosylase B [Pseudomonadota bacterium]
MKKKLFSSLLLLASLNLQANDQLPDVEQFIDEMVAKHGFDRAELENVFDQVEVKDAILKAISRPAEKSKPWYEYRNIFITDSRINGGYEFWQQHKEALEAAEKQYGVPAEIIIAILGVETRYGQHMGGYRVIDALSTLAFRYPPRSPFFRSELEKFLVLTHEEKISELEPVGSYAGAMGLGQFMPSSYLAYAVDFDGDGHRDIWTNPTDAIGSIANYLKLHGWVPGQSIVHPTQASKLLPQAMLANDLKPAFTRQQLQEAGFSLSQLPAGQDVLSVVGLTQQDGEEYWLGRQNFYAITRYNHSRMYAMAVYQLAQAIREKMDNTK